MKKLVIALALAATAAVAGAGPMERLNLSDAQKQQIRDIRSANRQTNHQLYADYRTKLRQFRQLNRAGDPGAAALRTELETMRTQVRAARQAQHQTVLNVLTAEQRQQLEQWRDDHPRGSRRNRNR